MLLALLICKTRLISVNHRQENFGKNRKQSRTVRFACVWLSPRASSQMIVFPNLEHSKAARARIPGAVDRLRGHETSRFVRRSFSRFSLQMSLFKVRSAVHLSRTDVKRTCYFVHCNYLFLFFSRQIVKFLKTYLRSPKWDMKRYFARNYSLSGRNNLCNFLW